MRILIRDDGSTDTTLLILDRYKNLYPEIITIIPFDTNKGATQNFNILISHSTADYLFFSDQDDKWEKDKITNTLAAFNPNELIPQMCFTDLCKINDKGDIISTSLYMDEKINPLYTTTNRLLMQNVPYGCTMAINRSLAEIIFPIPQEALLHDHWIALIASLFGEIHYIPAATILHRIHDANASRAASTHRKEQDSSVKSKLSNHNFHNYLRKLCRQADVILTRYDSTLSTTQKLMLYDFSQLESQHGLPRKWNIIKNKFYKHSLLHNLKTILRA
jgi:glycosyltransferase involved in cell wall biosynthesis